MDSRVLIKAEHLKKYFPMKEGLFKKKDLKAIDDVSVEIHEGETLALVGESGCGKSTLGRLLIHLLEPTEGTVYFMGEPLTDEVYSRHITDIQMIFQDPLSSLNPRMTVYDVIAEPLRVCHYGDEESIKKRVYELVDLVGFKKNALYRYPHEFSGGQCQRIGIARALALNPKLIVCDEPVSALDVSIKAQIINKFAEIQKETGVAYLFITHDLLTVRYVSNRIAVMYLGKIVEIADTKELYDNPLHPYTRALLSAIMYADVDAERNVIQLEGEIPSPINTPSGCPFRTRCKFAKPECADSVPQLKEVSPGHQVACLFLEEIR